MKIVAGLVPTFPLPKPAPYDFHLIYHAGDVDSKQRLEEVTKLREQVISAAVQGDSAACAMAIDSYMPALQAVCDAYDAIPGGFYNFGASSQIVWTSGGDKTCATQKPTQYTLYTLSYERCMIAATRGYCECNLAAQTLETPGLGDEGQKRALAFLKSAGAIFNTIATTMLPLKESLPVNRSPEVTPAYNQGLALLCRLSCQLLAINQAIIRGMAGKTVAKLYSGASTICEQSLRSFATLQADYKDLDPALKNYLNGGHHYLMAVGLRLAAVDEWAEAKHGEAVAHIAKSKELFGTAYASGIMSHASKSLTERVEADRSASVELHNQYDKENGLVYFGRLPKEEQPIEAKIVAAELGTFAWPGAGMQIVISQQKVV